MAVAIGTCLMLSTIGTGASLADHGTNVHWHNRPVTFRVNEDMTDKTAVQRAGRSWKDETLFNVERGNDVNHRDWELDGSHIVWRGAFPESQRDVCDPDTTIACSTVEISGFHVVDADTVLNKNMLWIVDCGSPTTYFPETESVALHELGHWARLVHSSHFSSPMYDPYNGPDCTISDHDVDAVRNIYGGHGS